MPQTFLGGPGLASPPRLNRRTSRLKDLVVWYRADPFYRRSQTLWPALVGTDIFDMTLTGMAANSVTRGWGGTTHLGGRTALQFDGANTYGQAGDPAPVQDLAQKTLALWVRVDDLNSGSQLARFIDKQSGIAGWFFQLDTTDITAGVALGQGFSGAFAKWGIANVLTANTWVHLAVSYDNTSLANVPTFYVNGRPTATPTTILGPSGTLQSDIGSPLSLGDNGSLTRVLDGALDDVQIFDRILAAQDIWDLYQASLRGWREEFRRPLMPRIQTQGGATTIGIAPATRVMRAQNTLSPGAGLAAVPSRDTWGYVVGETATFFLQTLNPDTGGAWDADSLPTYRIYEDGQTTPVTTGTYSLADNAATAGFYRANVTLDPLLGFEAGKQYSIRSFYTIVGASEAIEEPFQLTRRVLSIRPAQVRFTGQSTFGGPFINIRPAQRVLSPQTLGQGTTIRIQPALRLQQPQATLGNLRTFTPASVRLRAGSLPFARVIPIQPAVVMRAPLLPGLTLPRPPGEPLAAVAGLFVAGDWLIQSTRMQLKQSLTYAPDSSWEHRILAMSDIELTVAPGGGMATVGNFSFTLAEDGTGQSILQRWRRLATIGGTVDITVDYFASDGTLVRVFTGNIDTVTLRNGRSEIACVDESIQRNLQLPQTLVTSNIYARAASGALTQPLPLIYGAGSQLTAVPLLFTDTQTLAYTAAGHPVSMTSQIAVYNPDAQIFMPGTVSAILNSPGATITISSPLQQQLLNAQTGARTIFLQQFVSQPQNVIDGSSATIAKVFTSGTDSSLDGMGQLAIIATPTSSQRGNTQAVITIENHRRSPDSDPTVTGQFLVNTIDTVTSATLRSALFTTQNFRHSLNPQTTIQTLTGLAFGEHEAVQVVCLSRNEGGPGGVLDYYQVGEIRIQTGFVPQGDSFPVFAYGEFNGRRDGTGTVTPDGANTLYALPNHVIGSLLVDELGLTISDSLLAANTTYLQRNYIFAGGIGFGWFVTRANARDVLHDAAVQGAAILAPDLEGAWGLHPFDEDATPQMVFDDDSILCVDGAQNATADDATVVTLGNMQAVHCRFEVHYGWNTGSQKFDQMVFAYESGGNTPDQDDLRHRCQLSAIRYGITETLIINAYWIATRDAAVALLRHLVEYFSFQRISLQLDTTLRGLSLRLGDMVNITHPMLPEGDNGETFEIHGIRLSPIPGRISLTMSKRATVFLEYFIIRDQNGVRWYWWFDEAGQLARDIVVPDIPPFTAVEVSGTTTPPYWHHVLDESGVFWFLYPDTLGQLIVDTTAPAVGFGLEVGLGLSAIGLDAKRYRLAASGSPEEMTITEVTI